MNQSELEIATEVEQQLQTERSNASSTVANVAKLYVSAIDKRNFLMSVAFQFQRDSSLDFSTADSIATEIRNIANKYLH